MKRDLLFIPLVTLFISGCATQREAVGPTPLKATPNILIIVHDHFGGPNIFLQGSGSYASGLLGGAIGGAIYGSVQAKELARLHPLIDKMASCHLPADFTQQLVDNLSHRPGWNVQSSTGLEAGLVESMNRYYFESKASADEKKNVEAALAQAKIDELLLVDITFYGIHTTATSGSVTYDVGVEGRLVTPGQMQHDLWSSKKASRKIDNTLKTVDPEQEMAKEDTEICSQLLRQGRIVGQALALELGVSSSDLKAVEPPPAPEDQSQGRAAPEMAPATYATPVAPSAQPVPDNPPAVACPFQVTPGQSVTVHLRSGKTVEGKLISCDSSLQIRSGIFLWTYEDGEVLSVDVAP